MHSSGLDIDQQEQQILNSDVDRCKKWLDIEVLRDGAHWLPWRPDLTQGQQEEDCEDMERLVLFDDIAPVLIPLKKTQYLDIVLHFVSFLGVDVSSLSTPAGKCLHNINYTVFSHTKDSSFWTGGQFKDISSQTRSFIMTLLQNVLRCVEVNSQNILTEVMFLLQNYDTLGTKTSIKHLKKFAKGVLKEPHNRNNLNVWSIYGREMWRVGDQNETLGLLETFLKMHSTATTDEETQYGLTSLYKLYVMVLFVFKTEGLLVNKTKHINSPSDVLLKQVQQTLFCLIEGSNFNDRSNIPVTSSTILKVKSSFQTRVSDAVSKLSEQPHNVSLQTYICDILMCFSLFLWASTQKLEGVFYAVDKTIETVKSIYQTELGDKIKTRYHLQDFVEELHKVKLSIVCHHMSSVSSPLSFLRDALSSALHDCSGSTPFLTLLIQTELQSHITGRLDRQFTHMLKEDMSVVAIIMAVMSQVQRLETLADRTDQEDSGKYYYVLLNLKLLLYQN